MRDFAIILAILGLAYSVFIGVALYNIWKLLEKIAGEDKEGG